MRDKRHPDQLQLDMTQPDEPQADIEELVRIRAKEEAFQWRLRLIVIEALLLSAMIGAGGILIGMPMKRLLEVMAIVASSCFAGGCALIGLSFALEALCCRIRIRIARIRARLTGDPSRTFRRKPGYREIN